MCLRRVLPALLLLVVALAGVAGVAGSAQAKGKLTRSSTARCSAAAASDRGVLVIGDSLTYNSSTQIVQSLTARGYVVCLNGLTGRTTAEGLDVLRGYVARGQLPPTVVIGLGTNDPSTPSAQFRSTVEEIQFLVGSRELVWVNAFRRTNPAEIAGIKRVNADLAAAAAADPTMHVANWYSRAVSHPAYVKSDDIHLTASGNVARVALIASAVTAVSP